jgi:hypothetical protein
MNGRKISDRINNRGAPDGLHGFFFDGFVKNPNSALRYILRCFKVRKVLIITKDLRVLNVNFYTLPSKADFLQKLTNLKGLFRYADRNAAGCRSKTN